MGKYQVKTTKSGSGFVFNLKAPNGQVIATSEVYNTLESCKKGINSVSVNAPIANLEDQTVPGFKVETNPKFEIYTDKAGKFRFRLKARNGQIIAVSEGYTAMAGCLNGVESVRKNAVDPEIEMEE